MFLKTRRETREALVPTGVMPDAWEQIDAWMRPKLLEATPNHIREWVTDREKTGKVDASHTVLYYLFKTFTPGGPDEIAQLSAKILNPQVCSKAEAAQKELLR